jgi:DNA phosphorothioation-dependent restriction protein DptH
MLSMSYLAKLIAEKVRSELSLSMGGKNEAGTLRIFFSGPPPWILEAVYNTLVVSNESLAVNANGQTENIPVFLLKSGATDPQGEVKSAICSENYFVAAVRNNPAVSRCLILQNHISSVKSVDTTVTRLGGHLDFKDFENWYESIWIQNVIHVFVENLPNDIDRDRFGSAIEHTLRLSWDLESDKKQKYLVWKVLETVAELFNDSNKRTSLATITNCLGLISCDHGTFGSASHLTFNEKITDFFENRGLSAGLDYLKEKAPSKYRAALDELACMMRENHIMQASDLSDVGLHNIYGKSTSISNGASYWHMLTFDVWKELLEEDDVATKNEIVLDVKAISNLVDAQNGLPHVAQNQVDLSIKHNHSESIEIEISRSVGSAKYVILNTTKLAPDAQYKFSDFNIPEHQSYVRYRVASVDHIDLSVIQKWIVLDSYAPGIVITSRAAKKIKPFKLNKKAISTAGTKIERYESEISFQSMGQFQIELLSSKQISLPKFIRAFEVDSEYSEIECPISDDGICLIQTDEESYFDFDSHDSNNNQSLFRLFVTAEDTPPQGVPTEFERLVECHLSGSHNSSNTKVEAIKGRLYDLELQILDCPDLSHKPVVIGPDYMSSWSKVDWLGSAKISRLGMMHDLRPNNWESSVPNDFVAARKKVLTHLQQKNSDAYGTAEFRLHEFATDEYFHVALSELIHSYIEWLDNDYESAIWIDTFSFFSAQTGTHGLANKPYAILLSPFHPIKLVYQFEAQRLMFDAMAKRQECPAVSLFTPARFPDVFCLKHRTVSGGLDSTDFIGVESSNPYWGVFWSMDEVGRQDQGKLSMDLSDGFQLGLRGLTTGFTSQQMVRSLDEVTKLLSARTSLTVQLHSDAGGDSDCNLGIEVWASDRMLPENDIWTESGGLKVHVFDNRPVDMQPEQSTLAALTSSTNSNLQWHTDRNPPAIDLSVIASLNATQPQFDTQKIESAVDKLGLSRSRIRKRLPNHYLAESLVMRKVEPSDNLLKTKMLEAVSVIEAEVSNNGHDGFVFAPNVIELERVLNVSKYTAVSSSNVDFQSFSEIGAGKSFLWDYEIPSYSRSVGGADGYYLLATHSEGMDAAVRTALTEFGGKDEDFDDLSINKLLTEVSRRGMPTLKRLTGGGTLTMGELGMLAAVRLLQPDFTASSTRFPIFPIKGAEDSLCLLVPVDPFQAHIDSLRKSLHKKTGERPDLLSISLQYVGEELKKIKITAIEVKARRGELGTKGRSAAISQASHFSNFLIELRDKGADTEIWGLAWRALLVSLIDYSFRVYSGTSHVMDTDEWFKRHSNAIHSISRGTVEVQIDTTGRLIAIENIDKPSFLDSYDGDRFDETIVLSHRDAVDVISGKDSEFSKAVATKTAGWRLTFTKLMPGSAKEVQTTQNETPQESPDSKDISESPEPNMNLLDSQSGLRFDVGTTIGHFDNYPLEFYPANTALNQLNVGIVGDLGTGKTQLIKSLIFQLSARAIQNRGVSPNILIFDYKKDYSSEDFIKATRAKIISPYEIPLNIFNLPASPNPQRAQHERSRFFIDVLDKIYSGIGPVQKENIKSAVKQAYRKFELSELSPTLNDVFECYKEEGRVDIPYSIMSNLVESEYFVDQSDKVIPFQEFLTGVVVIDLSQILADDDKNMLVAIFLNLFYEYMLSVKKQPFIGKTPSLRFVDTMLLVDEADNIMKYEFEVLRKLLLQGREFGIGVLLASQYLSHFKTRNQNYLEPLLTWFIHKVPNITPKELENIGITSDLERMASKIRSLECHQCLYKSLDVQGEIMRGTPFFELLDADNLNSP